MATLFEDTFAGTAGASITSRNSDSGGSWAKNGSFTSGDATLAAGGTCYPSGSGVSVMVTDADVADGTIEAVLVVKSTGEQYSGIGLRIDPTSADWSVCAANDLTNHSLFGADTGFGGYTNQINPTDRPLLAVGTHTLKMSAAGSGTALYRSFINRREFSRIGTTQADTGRPGLFCGGPVTSTTGTHFTSFLVTDVTDATSTVDQCQFVGDSQTHGSYYDESNNLALIRWDLQWSQLVMDQLEAAGVVADWANLGSGGKTLVSMVANADSVSSSVNGICETAGSGSQNAGWGSIYVHRANAAHNVIVLEGGLNDIINSGASAADCYDEITAFVAAANLRGHRVIVMTNPYVTEGINPVGTIPAGSNTKLAALNTLIRANTAGAFGIADVHDDSRISTETTNATYRSQADGLHWLPAAQPLVANVVFPVVARAFEIADEVVTPAAADIILTGVVEHVEWNGFDVNVDILLSLDGGSTYPITIDSGVANTGDYDWTPTTDQITATAKLKIVDSVDSGRFAESGAFVIATTEATGGGGTSLVGFGSMLIRPARVGE